jgi:hypothetical protein
MQNQPKLCSESHVISCPCPCLVMDTPRELTSVMLKHPLTHTVAIVPRGLPEERWNKSEYLTGIVHTWQTLGG